MGFIKSFVTGDWDEWGEEELERINRRHEKERRRLERIRGGICGTSSSIR